jgi:carnitine O-acetyltransferase
MREAKNGNGIDRHLFVLRLLAEKMHAEKGYSFKICLIHLYKFLGIQEIPKIFTDNAYKASGRWIISTSHCGSPSISLFGFGPVVPDGFGGYFIV